MSIRDHTIAPLHRLCYTCVRPSLECLVPVPKSPVYLKELPARSRALLGAGPSLFICTVKSGETKQTSGTSIYGRAATYLCRLLNSNVVWSGLVWLRLISSERPLSTVATCSSQRFGKAPISFSILLPSTIPPPTPNFTTSFFFVFLPLSEQFLFPRPTTSYHHERSHRNGSLASSSRPHQL